MGKINNSVEIIPIDGPSGIHSRQIDQQFVNRMNYISDPFIVQRVRQYLEENVDKTYVDITEMADHLQNKFKEYSRRKRSAFRGLVKKAYAIVVRSYGDMAPSSSDSEIEECEDDEDNQRNNTMNSQLLQMYNRMPRNMMQMPVPAPPMLPQMQDNVLIDISSDDSTEAPEKLNVTEKNNSNGTSTDAPPSVSPSLLPTQFPPGEEKKISLLKISSSLLPSNNIPMEANDRSKKRKLETSSTFVPSGTSNSKRKKDIPLQESKFTFKDVGGVNDVLKDVCKLLLHIKHPEIYRQIGIVPPRGFLLHGPPGSGKTLLANAIAGEFQIPMLKVSAPELIGGISGESEERIRDLFDKALSCAPCIVFIDEIDAITQNRMQAQKDMERRIVAQLLTCLDDLSENEQDAHVLVIGATNRPDSLDPALRRAGRFDREVSLGIPNIDARTEILKVLTAKLKLAENFNYKEITKNCPGFVGADLRALTREAAMVAINRVFSNIKYKSKNDPQPNTTITSDNDKVTTCTENINTEEKEKPNDEEDPTTTTSAAAAPAPVQVSTSASSSDVNVNVDDDDNNAVDNGSNANDDDKNITSVNNDETKATNTETPTNFSLDLTKASLDELVSWLHGQVPLSSEQLSDLCIIEEDFEIALKHVQPSAKREGFATVPDVTWDDVGSLQDIRQELQMSILAPVRFAEQFESLGISSPTGVLLCGPPGCGKTLLAKAVANEAGINFISVKGPELLNMYVGESERAVRQCFQRARNSSPCVIFFDELDALCPKRSDSKEGGASMRVVNQMLTEMDGVEGRNGVFVMAASNRPDIIDPAVLRPGRLDKIIYVGLPSPDDRYDILKAITKNGTRPKIADDVDLEIISKCEQCDGYTGADLAALVREAGMEAIKEYMILLKTDTTTTPMDDQLVTSPFGSHVVVTNQHFQKAILKIKPSVTERDQKHYEKLQKLYGTIKETTQLQTEQMECS